MWIVKHSSEVANKLENSPQKAGEKGPLVYTLIPERVVLYVNCPQTCGLPLSPFSLQAELLSLCDHKVFGVTDILLLTQHLLH